MQASRVQSYFETLQDQICEGIIDFEKKTSFKEDPWEREEGGGGKTRVLQGGDVIEKGGVNFSAVHGPLPQKIADALEVEAKEFLATGISIIMHPVNPWVPIIHMNLRYFVMENGNEWFGGGIDLTPHYVCREQTHRFHQQLKSVCDQHHEDYYLTFKQWADDYFYIAHRQEARGVGGIFFDRLSEQDNISMQERFEFVKEVGEVFLPLYQQLLQNNKDKEYEEREYQWQQVRRSRYVEFNLVYDKGTKFGLDTGGRIESILISMPPVAQWPYNYQPKKGTKEAETLKLLKKDPAWLLPE